MVNRPRLSTDATAQPGQNPSSRFYHNPITHFVIWQINSRANCRLYRVFLPSSYAKLVHIVLI
jgi:hypothetical protein